MSGVKRRRAGSRARFGAALVLGVLLTAWSPLEAQGIALEQVVGGFDLPVGVTGAGDGSGRLFVTEQGGRVLIVESGQALPQPFLDIAGRLSCCGERGLLGLAFHPNFRRNGRLFVNYTDGRGSTVISEFGLTADPNRADAGSERVLLTYSQPFSNHNGGHIAFGPDGFLYVASGDGGSGGDPQNNGQALDTLLGKLLRLDVDQGVPASNPFAGGGGLGEIWAFGLRNPWRFSFDRKTGDLYIGDVGQNAIEEIDFQRAASSGGENYGWRLKEGNRCFEPASGCDDGTLTEPILQYDHSLGCSVTAGFRYRGPATDALPRFFVYGDFCSGRIWGGIADGSGAWRSRLLLNSGLSISSFGEDDQGRLYVVDYRGVIYRVEGLPVFASDFEGSDTSDWSDGRGGLEVVAPGLKGSGGALEVPVDGTVQRRFLESNEPRNESTFHVEFLLSADRVDLGNAQVTILELESADLPVLLTLEQRGRKYFVNCVVAERAQGGSDSASTVRRLVGSVRVPRARSVLVGLEFLQARSTSSADGEIRLLKKGRVRARIGGLLNGRSRVDGVKIGLPQGSAGAIGGAFRIDDYRSSY